MAVPAVLSAAAASPRSNSNASHDDIGVAYVNSICASSGCAVHVQLTKTKGRVLLAGRSFRQGEVILEERPLAQAVEVPGDEVFEKLQFLCSERPEVFSLEPIWYWLALSSLIGEQRHSARENCLLPAAISDEAQRCLLLLHGAADVKAAGPDVQTLIEEFRLDKLEPLTLERLVKVWSLTCFECYEEPRGCAIYFRPSFMSHSCLPSALWTLEKDSMFVLRARRDIAENDEVTISYLSDELLFEIAPWRQEHLHASKNFWCTCERCTVGSCDLSRGFCCPAGCKGIVFCRVLPRVGSRKRKFELLEWGSELVEAEALLANVACTGCGLSVSCAEAEHLMSEERWLNDRLQEMEDRSPRGLMSEEMAGQLKQQVEVTFAQHATVDKIYGHLVAVYSGLELWRSAEPLLARRVAFRRNAYPFPNYAQAWASDQQASWLLRIQGVKGPK